METLQEANKLCPGAIESLFNSIRRYELIARPLILSLLLRFCEASFIRRRMQLVLLLPLVFWSNTAHAFIGQCTLVVEGKTYIRGYCNIDLFSDGTGSFSIGTGAAATSNHFAYVIIDPRGYGNGTWNGPDSESHAHNELGVLVRQGACWVNANAKICAMRE